jgi:hypothetical protein
MVGAVFISTAPDKTRQFSRAAMFRNWSTTRLAISLALAIAATWLFHWLYAALAGQRLPNSPMLVLAIFVFFFAVIEAAFVGGRKLLGYRD